MTSRVRRFKVAAVEDTAVQVTFAAGAGELRFTAGDSSHWVSHCGGPGVTTIHGLTPGTELAVSVQHGATTQRLRTRTLAAPPGAELSRLATISDLHIGSRKHGLAGTMFDRSHYIDPAPVRCARGAITEAVQWGAELLVGKGDLTQHGWADEWQQLGNLLDVHAAGVARLAVPGNHDKPRARNIAAADGLTIAGCKNGVVEMTDLDGVRVIAIDSARDNVGVGTLQAGCEEAIELCADAARAGRAALICLHHPLERAPVQLQYPKGVPWPEARRFAQRVSAANPRSLITAGHTHRNRRRNVGPLVHTEVGSTKDWPGVWAGYVVHEGGIRQVVRRIAATDALGWIDYSRWAAGGLWWFYSPGRLADRCFTHLWEPSR